MDRRTCHNLLASRRSVRRFTDEAVPRELIEHLVQAACLAPSNHNRQGWKFVVFTDRREIADLAQRCRSAVQEAAQRAAPPVARRRDELARYAGAFAEAPVVLLAMHKASPAVGRGLLAEAVGDLASGEALSTAMAVQNLLLAAAAAGLGACVMTAPLLAGTVWQQVPDLPAGFAPTCLIALGRPAETPAPPRRKALQHVLEYRGRP